ncbi:MAG TPA: bifunctional phosphoglucose/phosphomannose isomerase [bacterium]|jgi:glucose/mannose-6-phosphate isomerase|nr:bifunctional phosphoglucose/phosphomannose isomerase [bacterium]
MKKHILDNPDQIYKLDPQHMLHLVETVPQQCRDARHHALLNKIKLNSFKIDSLVICGVGGSAIGGEMVANYLRSVLKIPVYVNRDYALPAWVDRQTLVICSSHSGDTEETLSAFKQALARKLNIVIISSGGTLLKEARKHKLPYYEMPGGVQPRTTLNYSLITLLTMLESAKLLPSMDGEIEEAVLLLEKTMFEFNLFNDSKKNLAKQLALFFYGKNPVIYASENCLGTTAYRWKCQFNENAKQMAHVNAIPEMNHNEILSYTIQDSFVKNAAVLLLRSGKYENDRVQKRFAIFKKISGLKKNQVSEVWAEGNSLLSQTLWMVYLGDFVSVYLAFLKGLNPTSIGLIDQLKAGLKK